MEGKKQSSCSDGCVILLIVLCGFWLFSTCSQLCSPGPPVTETKTAVETETKHESTKAELAQAAVKAAIREGYPTAVINWATQSTTESGGTITVSYEYSVINAFGTRVQRKFTGVFDAETLEVKDAKDEFLYFRE